MGDFIGLVWWMIVSFGLLVIFYEFGYYWVVCCCGVKVLCFFVGFGWFLWMWCNCVGIEFVIVVILFGGYVKMFDECEVEVLLVECLQVFNNKIVWQWIVVVVVGLLVNLLFCVVLFWVMFVIGCQDYLVIIGCIMGMVQVVGFQVGDWVLWVDGCDVVIVGEVSMVLIMVVMDCKDVQVEVLDIQDQQCICFLLLLQLLVGFDECCVLVLVGLNWQYWLQLVLVDSVVLGLVVDGVLLLGDLIVVVDGQCIEVVDQVLVQVLVFGQCGGVGMIDVLCVGEWLVFEVIFQVGKGLCGQVIWQFGIVFLQGYVLVYDVELKFGLFVVVLVVLCEIVCLVGDLLGMMCCIVIGNVFLKNVFGLVIIVQVVNGMVKCGVDWFLYFLVLLLLSLCIINLLFIFILDGGYLLYYFIELVKGSLFSECVMVVGQYIGLVLLVGLMGLVFYNDIFGLVQ